MEQTQSNMTIGKRIAQHRKRLGLTQDQLAEKVGVSPQAVSKWENNQSCPDISILPVLAKIFSISTDELLGMEHDMLCRTTAEENEPNGIHISHDDQHLDINFDPVSMKNGSIIMGVWIIAIGAMMLLGHFVNIDVSLWEASITTPFLIQQTF